jgi:hypothetical protein
MKKEDLVILILGLLLLAGMLITILFGGEKSRHGVGSLPVEGGQIFILDSLRLFPVQPELVQHCRSTRDSNFLLDLPHSFSGFTTAMAALQGA